MSSFTAACVFQSTNEFRGSRRVYELTTPFRYYVGGENSSLWVDVPSGLRTDLASVPRLLRGVFSPDGVWAQAAIMHDYLYHEGLVSRRMCDLIFYEAMRVLGVGLITRYLIFWGVRAGGWIPYGRYRRGIQDGR